MRKSAPLFCALLLSLSARRAWIEIPHTSHDFHVPKSLSARRAWIEIISALESYNIIVVALRKESVDRNVYREVAAAANEESLSARRAWIEMRLDAEY